MRSSAVWTQAQGPAAVLLNLYLNEPMNSTDSDLEGVLANMVAELRTSNLIASANVLLAKKVSELQEAVEEIGEMVRKYVRLNRSLLDLLSEKGLIEKTQMVSRAVQHETESDCDRDKKSQ